MRLSRVHPDDLRFSPELDRTARDKSFEERLRSSIEEIGLAEPLKVAIQPNGTYLLIDGNLRLRAIRAIREKDESRFATVPVYVVDFERRFEIRFQSDIYQDLLPSQLATLVEHLHKSENVLKVDIARYIGVSPATLRNYTGLWRLKERRGLFAGVVDLMDAEVFPASNPYAWLRLTEEGIHKVIRDEFAKGDEVHSWIAETVQLARRGEVRQRYPLKYIEMVTAALPNKFYRHGEDLRAVKRDLGLRRAAAQTDIANKIDCSDARRHLARVSGRSLNPVIRSAAGSLKEYLT